MRQTNAVVKKILEIEKCGKNLIFGNIPEQSDDERGEDANRIKLGERHIIQGKLVFFHTQDDRDKVRESGEKVKLANGVFITQDKTFNQRQEARLYREEKEREEEEEAGVELVAGASAVAPRGRTRGRPRGSTARSVRGRGRTSNQLPRMSQSRKRQNSDSEERESSRRRTEENSASQNLNRRQDGRAGRCVK